MRMNITPENFTWIWENQTIMERMMNATEEVEAGIEAFAGHWQLLIGALVLIIATVLVVYLLKQIVANAVIGVIALLFVRFVLGIPIPLTPLVILVSVLGGGGGVGALLIATYFGWL